MRNFKRVFVFVLMIISATILIGCDGFDLNSAKLKLTADKTTIGVGEQVTLAPKITVGNTGEFSIPAGIEYKSSDKTVLTVSDKGVVEGVSVGNATITASVVFDSVDLEAKLDFVVKLIPLTPTNLQINNGILSWDNVSGATSYLITINQTDHTSSVNSFDLKTLTLNYGNHEVKVYSKTAEEQSSAATITYIFIDPQVEEDMYKTVLSFINDGYVPDMELNDFDFEHEFNDYLYHSKLARAYTKAALQTNITVSETEDIIDTFNSVTSTNPQNVAEVKTELDKFRNLDIEPNQLSNVVLELMLVMADSFIESSEEDSDYYQGQLDYWKNELAFVKTQAQFIQVMASIAQYASEKDKLIFAEYANGTGDLVYYEFRQIIEDVYYDLQNNTTNNIDFYRNYYNQDIIQTILNLVVNAYNNNDATFINNLKMNIHLVERAHQYQHEVLRYEKDMERMATTIREYENIKNLVVENKQAFLTSLNTSFTYVFDLYDQIDGALVQMIDNLSTDTNVTPEEVIILKDELVDLFKETLPSAQEFENMYLALLVVMFDYLEINTSEMVGFSIALGTMENLSLTLVLNVLEDFDITMYNELSTIITGIYTPGSWDDTGYIYTQEKYDARKIVELVVYLGNYYNDFTIEYSLQLQALDALQTNVLQQQFDKIVVKLIDKVVPEDSQKTVIVSVWENYVENRALYEAVNDLYKKYGGAAFDKFIETNGKIALDIIKFVEDANAAKDIKPLANDFKVIFDQLFEYHGFTVEELTQTEINTLVDFLISNSRFALLNFSDEDTIQFDEFITNITPEVKQIIKLVIELEIDLVTAFKTNNAAFEFINLTDKFNSDETFAIQLFKALDLVLTNTNKDKIDNGLDILFTNIFTETYYMDMVGLTLEEIQTKRSEVDVDLLAIFGDIERVAGYDYNNLTQAQYDDFVLVMSFFK